MIRRRLQVGWVVTAAVGAVLVLISELTRGAVGDRVGPYGYLALIAGGFLALRSRTGTSRLSRALAILFVVNTVAFLLLEFGKVHAFELIAMDFAFLFVSGVLGGAAAIAAAVQTALDGNEPPTSRGAALLAGVAVAAALLTAGAGMIAAVIGLILSLFGQRRPILFAPP